MTRDDIVTFATTATGYEEPDDVAAAQIFIEARDRLIYDFGLWKSSLVLCPLSFNAATNADNAQGLVILPSVIKRVVAMRTTGTPGWGIGNGGYSLRIRGLEYYFRVDYDAFTQSGSPQEFAINGEIWFNARLAAGDSVTCAMPNAGDAAVQIKVQWRDSTGQRTVTTGVSPLVLNPAPGDGFVAVEHVYKSVNTAGALNLTSTGTGAALGSLTAAAGSSPLNVLARIFPVPNASFQLNVCGKARYADLQLNFGTQEPTIANSETALIALLRVDLLRRGGENGEAETALIEALGQNKDGSGGLFQRLKDIELVQEAQNVCIVPEDGYGPEWGIGPYLPPYYC
jgi:hypothetical protein